MPPSDKIVHSVSLYVRYAETDAMGIVHHGSYIVYFEEGRSHYARARGNDYAEFERAGYYLAVTEVHARYVKPAVYGQRVRVQTWIDEMHSRALTFAYEIVDDDTGDVLVTGTSKHICLNRENKVAHIPAAWRAWGES